ncbi:hypothetical protein AB0G60_17205 [Streptomyces angustmyceticus]|uniref:Uncharacterized protein n=1 Tax=Streptomyces angustmyceticus TaxID=285578 RepID=A0A5J4LKM2_9ACTN|nr:hypothetical protein [Streptomyces angustmyceticus]UAL71052.1 hypothetical protein K7396_34660 [Streptomyces angustmyceticus]GES32501.1 hypothetical protein San01_49880 [Streptomyces angustmyceticus]
MSEHKGLRARIRDWWRRATGGNDARTAGGPEAADEPAEGTGSTPAHPAAPAEVAVELPPGDDVLSVAARGDVFAFEVVPHFRWSSREMTLETLRERAVLLEEAARCKLLRRAWSVARTFDPGDPVAAEKAVNKELRGGWCYNDEKGLIRCRASVRMRIDPGLREHVLPFHLAELRLTEEHRLGELKAGQVQARTERWLRVMSELELLGTLGPAERRLLVPFAAALADEDFFKVMQALKNTRRNGAQALADVLTAATKHHEQVGLFEYANAYDKALSEFCRQMGLSPFSWVDTVTDVEELAP